VVCTYSLDLVTDTLKCIKSLLEQDYQDKEIILVVDEDEELSKILRESLTESIKIVVNNIPGLSEARNIGIKNATGDIIAFIDDDAIAAPNFISKLVINYTDQSVIGVGGKVLPLGKPAYPEELFWIGGFTYKGHPENKCQIRNAIGCNMSFRKEVFDKVGAFDTKLGRIGKNLITAEETEFCVRVLKFYQNHQIVYDPEIIVYHKVHPTRQKIKYLIMRGFKEGQSKAYIKQISRKNDVLSTERDYVLRIFLVAIPERMEGIITGKNCRKNLHEIVNLSIVMGFVGIGYIFGSMNYRMSL
jgi:glycosyltransferase involved in cell wall biosynthesis